MLWPTVAELTEYRQTVYDTIVDVIMNHPAYDTLATDIQKSQFWALVLGFEHERIHLETSSVLIRELPLKLVRQPEAWPGEIVRRLVRGKPPALVVCHAHPGTIVDSLCPDSSFFQRHTKQSMSPPFIPRRADITL
jgi:DNA repair protein RadC